MFYITATWFIDSINYFFEHVVRPVLFSHRTNPEPVGYEFIQRM